MTVDLEFRGAWKPPNGGSADLDFGDARQAAPEAASATVRLRLGPPKARIRAAYDNQVSRKLEGGGRVPWQRAHRQGAGLQDGWDDSARDRCAAAASWQPTVALAGSVQSAGGDNQRARSASRVRWQRAESAPSSTADRINPLVPQHAGLGLPWGEGGALSGAVLSPFVWLVPRSRGQSQAWQPAVPLALREVFRFSPGRGQSGRWSLPWEIGRQPRPGESHLPVAPPVVEPAPRYHPDLDFICHATRQGLAWRPALGLDFGTHPCGQSDAGVFSVPI
ncbi:hypothetical protein ACQUJV_25135, partial [Ralstonia pseudosolanacearum]